MGRWMSKLIMMASRGRRGPVLVAKALAIPTPVIAREGGRSSIPEAVVFTEKPRRTGFPAFAGNDSGGWGDGAEKTLAQEIMRYPRIPVTVT